jgi:hypothetical protein
LYFFRSYDIFRYLPIFSPILPIFSFSDPRRYFVVTDVGNTGFSLIFATMSWASRKQKFVALHTSTAEGKYIAASTACTKEVWLRKLVSELSDQVLDSIVIYCDDQSCVKLLENPLFHDKSKHIEIKDHFLCDKV